MREFKIVRWLNSYIFYDNINMLENIQYFDILRSDKSISGAGLEARVPFLSHHFVDLYLSIEKNVRHPIKKERIEK